MARKDERLTRLEQASGKTGRNIQQNSAKECLRFFPDALDQDAWIAATLCPSRPLWSPC